MSQNLHKPNFIQKLYLKEMRETPYKYKLPAYIFPMLNWPGAPLPTFFTQMYLLHSKFSPYTKIYIQTWSKNNNNRKTYTKPTTIYTRAAHNALDI